MASVISNKRFILLMLSLSTLINQTTSLALSKSNVKTASKTKKFTNLLVPPPPATPSYIIDNNGSYTSFGLTTNKEGLSLKQAELNLKLKHAKENFEDETKGFTEKSEKANSFTSLYDEGVVSRKELEKAKDDVKKSQNKCDEYKQSIKELEQQLEYVKKQLSAYSKKNKK